MSAVKFSVSIPTQLVEIMDDYCKRTGFSRSKVLQMAINEFVEHMEEKKPEFSEEAILKSIAELKKAVDSIKEGEK